MKLIDKLDKYWRAANYLTLAHIYLKDNALQERELELSDIKVCSKGHWGTSPGVNFIIAHINNYISFSNKDVQLIIGTGHSGNALCANLFLEGSIQRTYEKSCATEDALKEFLNLEKNILGIRSEIGPFYPGTIYDGGELGYSLAVAMGAVLDNEDLTVVVVLGDGECETGCISAAWNSIKCLGTRRGHILPIINLNGYRMGGKSLLSTMSENEITNMFGGMGYDVYFVYGEHEEMISAITWADEYFEKNRDIYEGRNPLIVLKTPKGWTALKDEIIQIEGNIRSHKNPLGNLEQDKYKFNYLRNWLKKYRPDELFDKKGELCSEAREIIPVEEKRLGKLKYINKKLVFPPTEKFALKTNENMECNLSGVRKYLEELICYNGDCFKIVSPDELTSNRFGELTKYKDNVLEVLNEALCQAWMQGYTLTGRTGLMISYEAFMPIISSMVSQYTKYLYQSEKTGWRAPCPSLNYLLTSTCWENTYSHQNPEFVNSIIAQENRYARIYYPIDGNTLLECLDKSLKSESQINVITVSKGGMSQLTDTNTARKAVENSYIIWKEAEGDPDVCFVSIGDYCLREMQQAVVAFEKKYPNLSYNFISVLELMRYIGIEENEALSQFCKSYLKGKVVIILFHGYPLIIKAVLDHQLKGCDYAILGYRNRSISSAGFHEKMEMNGCSVNHILSKTSELLYKNGTINEEDYYEFLQ